MRIIPKTILFIFALFTIGCNSSTQSPHKQEKNEIQSFADLFKDLEKHLAKENGNLWNHRLYGPILLVNPENRKVFANEKGTKGTLEKNGDIYVGILLNEINIANTAFDWNGKRWSMVILPLPEDKEERLGLLTHELFHRVQPEIGFAGLFQKTCNHLDDKEGRTYLKLEFEALNKALQSIDENAQKEHLKNALLFREFRYQLYPKAKEKENLLELNEGLAEYTGSILSGRNDQELREWYIQAIESIYGKPTFVRSFAYKTIPVYGFFMQKEDKHWNLNVSAKTNLTDFITGFFDISIPGNLKDSVLQIRDAYNYVQINRQETKRAMEQKGILAKYDRIFKENPVLSISFQNMNISFDPGNLIPYRNLGTIYPNLRITDDWGVLTVDKGALVSKDWGEVIVGKPTKTSDMEIKGDGWKLELNDAWELVKAHGNYTLKMKQATPEKPL